MSTPRVFIARHGETVWSLSGKHTGVTDIPLTADGEKRVRATGRALVGNDRLIVPNKLTHIFVSPRKRAQRTFELLNLGFKDLPWNAHGPIGDAPGLACNARIEITEDIREWDYGEYEGITSAKIRSDRKEQGLGENWDIWRDGCPGGESPEQVTERMDRLIAKIRSYQAPFMQEHPDNSNHSSKDGTGDVLVVGHGHILRAFAMRWVGKTLQEGPTFLMEAGGVGTLSYEHHSIDEPAILLGGAFVESGADLPQHDDTDSEGGGAKFSNSDVVGVPIDQNDDTDSEGGCAKLSNGDVSDLRDTQRPLSEDALHAPLEDQARRLVTVETKANAIWRRLMARQDNDNGLWNEINALKNRVQGLSESLERLKQRDSAADDRQSNLSAADEGKGDGRELLTQKFKVGDVVEPQPTKDDLEGAYESTWPQKS